MAGKRTLSDFNFGKHLNNPRRRRRPQTIMHMRRKTLHLPKTDNPHATRCGIYITVRPDTYGFTFRSFLDYAGPVCKTCLASMTVGV